MKRRGEDEEKRRGERDKKRRMEEKIKDYNK